jgi:hypothetical protein
MIQDKTQSAVNGMSFTMTATPYWSIRVAPYGRVVKQSSAVLRPLARTGRAEIVRRAAPMVTVRTVTRRDAPSGF